MNREVSHDEKVSLTQCKKTINEEREREKWRREKEKKFTLLHDYIMPAYGHKFAKLKNTKIQAIF